MRNPSARFDFIHVVQRMAPGGIETLALDLVRADGNGAVVSFEGTPETLVAGWPALEAVGDRLTAFDAGPGLKPSLLLALVRHFRATRPRAVFLHHIGPFVYGGLAARLAGVPSIVHVEHDVWHYADARRRRLAAAMEWLVRPEHVAVSEHGARVMGSVLGARNVAVIYNGIDLARFRPGDRVAACARHGLDPAWRIVGTAGRLVPVKGHEVLVEAARHLPPEVHVAIAGSGPEQPSLEARAAALGVSSRVHFLGHVDAVETVLPAFDVFCLPSHNEGFPRSVIEAQAAGLPVVATDVGALREALCPLTSRIVPPAEPAALAAACMEALRMTDRAAARTFVEHRFSWSETVSAYNRAVGGTHAVA